ncbi:hypothetical protein Dimus_002603 [Dionaea muscipula]
MTVLGETRSGSGDYENSLPREELEWFLDSSSKALVPKLIEYFFFKAGRDLRFHLQFWFTNQEATKDPLVGRVMLLAANLLDFQRFLQQQDRPATTAAAASLNAAVLRDVWACGGRRWLCWAVVVEGSGDSGRRARLGGVEEAISLEVWWFSI